MKQRAGFVSNSSTASFVLVGFEVPASDKDSNLVKLREFFGLPQVGEDSDGPWDEDLFNAMDQADVRYATHSEQGAPDEDTHLLGIVVGEVRSDSGGWRREVKFTFEELTEKVSPLAAALGIRKSEHPIRLYTGTRMA